MIKTISMIKLLLLTYLWVITNNAYPQVFSAGYVHTVAADSTATYSLPKEKLLVCQVLRLTNTNKEKSLMVVFCETPVKDSKQRARMRNDYMLKRERIYLSRVFFADVEVLEERKVLMEVKPFLKTLEEKYDGLKLWAVLNADTIFK